MKAAADRPVAFWQRFVTPHLILYRYLKMLNVKQKWIYLKLT